MHKREIRYRDDPREVTKWLAANEVKGGILEMPFTTDQYLNHALYMIQSLHHFHPLANGYGSFFPPYFFALTRRVDKLPDPVVLQALAVLDIRTYVLHLDLADFMRMADTDEPVSRETVRLSYWGYDTEEGLGVSKETQDAFANSPYLREVARFPKDIVYEYTLPVEVAEVLQGRIVMGEVNQKGQLLVYIEFTGSGGKAWRNPRHPKPIIIKVSLFSDGGGRGKIGPFDTEVFIPQIITPGKKVMRSVVVDELPEAGSYRVEISSPEKFIRVAPTTLNLQHKPNQTGGFPGP